MNAGIKLNLTTSFMTWQGKVLLELREVLLAQGRLEGALQFTLCAVLAVFRNEHLEICDARLVLVALGRLLGPGFVCTMPAAEDSEVVFEAGDSIDELRADVDELLKIALVVVLGVAVVGHGVVVAGVDVAVYVLVGLDVFGETEGQLLQEFLVIDEQQQTLLLLYLHCINDHLSCPCINHPLIPPKHHHHHIKHTTILGVGHPCNQSEGRSSQGKKARQATERRQGRDTQQMKEHCRARCIRLTFRRAD